MLVEPRKEIDNIVSIQPLVLNDVAKKTWLIETASFGGVIFVSVYAKVEIADIPLLPYVAEIGTVMLEL